MVGLLGAIWMAGLLGVVWMVGLLGAEGPQTGQVQQY